MNANYGLFTPLEGRARGRDKKEAMAARADAEWTAWAVRSGLELCELPKHVANEPAEVAAVSGASL